MRTLALGLMTLIASQSFAVGRGPAATSAPIDLSIIAPANWSSTANTEVSTIGPIVGIPGGVHHSIPQNQRSGEDCWSYSINGMLEAFLKSKKSFNDDETKFSPEYLEFWHLYAQMQTDMPQFIQMINQMKTNPNAPVTGALIDRIATVYGAHSRHSSHSMKSRKNLLSALKFDPSVAPTPVAPSPAASVPAPAASAPAPAVAASAPMDPPMPVIIDTSANDSAFEVPDVGSDGPTAIGELMRFGTVTYAQFPVKIATDAQETALEEGIRLLVGTTLNNALKNGLDLTTFQEDSTGAVNMNLVKLIKSALEPIYKHAVPLPTDQWIDDWGNRTSATGMLAKIENLGFHPDKDLKAGISATDTFDDAVKAIAVSLLSLKLPAMMGMPIFNDPIASSNSTVQDFMENNGLFDSAVCAANSCTSENGDHEVEVVNFLGKMKDGSALPKGLYPSQLARLIMEGKFQVTAVIIKNSWGPGGYDINGRTPTDQHGTSGYYVVTVDYLRNSTAPSINDPFDFVISSKVAKLFPKLSAE